MKGRTVVIPLAIARIALKKNSSFFIRDNRLTKGDLNSKESKKSCQEAADNEDDDEDENEDDDNADVDDVDVDDDDDNGDVSSVKPLPELLKKHNVYFGKFIVSRK